MCLHPIGCADPPPEQVAPIWAPGVVVPVVRAEESGYSGDLAASGLDAGPPAASTDYRNIYRSGLASKPARQSPVTLPLVLAGASSSQTDSHSFVIHWGAVLRTGVALGLLALCIWLVCRHRGRTVAVDR